jgi:hypothetical protein
MSQTQNLRRFRANPVEVAIFFLVSTIFVHSVYNLVYDHQGFEPISLVPLNSNPLSEGRAPASANSALLNLDVTCGEMSEKTSSAHKVRLHGNLCGSEPNDGGSKLIKSTITNKSNQFNATVFTDSYNGNFSTDYIPLMTGKNTIRLEFSYQGGNTAAHEFTLNKP